MKKSLLALVALAAVGLAACGETPEPAPGPGPEPGPTPSVEVPTEEGKCTFYLSIGEGNIEFKEYESIYLTGGLNGWKTGYDAFELTKLEGQNVYYVQIANDAFDTTASQGLEYQLVLGYNAKANMPAASSGLQWVDGRKSEECAAPGGLGNLSFVYNAGDLKVDLGSHHWVNSLPAPAAPLKNYSFMVEFEEAVPEYGKVLIFGSYPGCGWTTPADTKTAEENKAIIDGATMTPNEDRTVWTISFESMVAGDYDCKILVEYTTAETTITWNAVDQTKDNYNFSITQADGDNYTLDILGEKATFELADPNVTLPLEIVVKNIGGDLDPAVEGLGIGASFNGWTISGNMCALEGEDYVYRHAGVNGTIEFAVMSKSDWSDQAHFADGNIKVAVDTAAGTAIRVTVKCDFSKFGSEAQVLTAEENIVVEYADAPVVA